MPEPWEHLELQTAAASVDATKLFVQGIEGVAEISRPYRYEITFDYDSFGGLAEDVIDEMLREPCTARWGPSGEGVIHGRLESIETETIFDPARVRYRAVLAPRLARFRHTVRSRVFQDVDVGDIARSMLGEHRLREGSDYELRLSRAYPKHEYVVQYQESDLAFFSRQLEHHGVHFHFVQDGDRERLVIADANRAFEPANGTVSLPYITRASIAPGSDGVHALARRVQVGASTVLLTDFNWRTPQVLLSNQARADATTGAGVLHQHGEHYKDPTEGAELARVRAEQILCERVRYAGEATLYEMGPGYRFELTQHPLGEYERGYVIVRADLVVRAGQAPVHRQTIELAQSSEPYRPARTTPKPRIYGFVHGRVDAPAHSTAAPVDEHGRYKVLLPFDLNGQPGGKASRWIRVAQPSSGPNYGVHIPMHLGAEVAIAHLDGDPDRPVIVGTMHNADTVNPVANANATQSWIQTQAGIRVLFDDDVS
jgi:type VI secretion system secreted protein VgrG